jgi:hypothetical protein
MENSIDVPQKLKPKLPCDPMSPLLGVYLRDVSQDTIGTLAYPFVV